MDTSKNLDWLAPFLPKLRCPNTGGALRIATEEEMKTFQAPEGNPALINAGSTHLYPVIEGIPHLLPGSGLTR